MAVVLTVLQILVIGTLLVFGFRFANKKLVSHFEGRPHLKFRRQLIQMGGALLAVLLVILFMPVGDVLRGQLLSLYGLIVSATIALSSTTLVGNVMAGIMLKTIGSCRPGCYITVGDHFGRISAMDLMHTEIQTEERDLTTLPNLYLVTHPVRVMHDSGSVLSVELSLGYDVSRHLVEELLVQAARDTELESPYVQIRELGDHSVTYRVSGLLNEVNRLLDKRRELRARTMDSLHAAGVEIVSPSFMNTRAFDKDTTFIPEVDDDVVAAEHAASTDSLVFDKAEKAASVSSLREKLAELELRLKAVDDVIANPANEAAAELAVTEKAGLEDRIVRMKLLIDKREAKISSR